MNMNLMTVSTSIDIIGVEANEIKSPRYKEVGSLSGWDLNRRTFARLH